MIPLASQTTPASPAPVTATVSRMALKNVKKGIIVAPQRILIYGPEKVGKSTFAAGAPSPIFLGKDAGTLHLDVARFPQPTCWRDVLDALTFLLQGGHDFETLVVDPINWFEYLVHQEVVGSSGKSIEAWNGGYGRGYDAALNFWRIFLDLVERLWERGMGIIFSAHAKVKKFNDPSGPGYERWVLAMANERAADMLRQWVDTILFAVRESYGKAGDDTRIRGTGSGIRLLHTEWSPAFDAGNRSNLPATMSLGWEEYANAFANGLQRRTEQLKEVDAMLAELGDAEVEAKVRSFLRHPRADVAVAHNGVAAKLDEHRKKNLQPTTTTEGAPQS